MWDDLIVHCFSFFHQLTDSSKPVSSAFKKASSTSSIMGIGMMMGGPGGALKMPMMSMFDEIRKRRVIE